jgi:hypothetical protein
LFSEYVEVGDAASQALSDDTVDEIQKSASDDVVWPTDYNAKGPKVSFGGQSA